MMEENKIRFKFKKIMEFKYLSHLETVRLIIMAIARAKIKVRYSEGFTPNPKINFSFPVPVGLASFAEYSDIEIYEKLSATDFKAFLNAQLTEKLTVIDSKNIFKKAPSLMADIELCSYCFKIKSLNKTLNNNIKNDIINKINNTEFESSIYNIDLSFDEINSDIVYLNLIGYTKLSKNNKIFKFNDFLKYFIYLSNNNFLVVEDYFKKEAYVLRNGMLKTPLEIV